MEFLLRVEAVNLDGFMGDSQDLSTVRGGSLILLDTVEGLAGRHKELRKVFTGASVGLFQFDAADDQAAEALGNSLAEELAGNAPGVAGANTRYATFQVAVTAVADGGFHKASARLQTQIRVQQLQSPTVVLPKAADHWDGVCEVDDIRPAEDTMYRQGGVANRKAEEKMKVSLATLSRRRYGIDRKHQFLVSRQACDAAQEVVNDFEQLTDYPPAGLLHRKLALIFLDGNKFGNFGRNCRTPEESRAWSSFVQQNQDAFLRHLLSLLDVQGDMTPWRWSGEVVTNNGTTKHKNRSFRLEVLRWAGDDLIFVVPAWCGWKVLGEFYRVFGTLPGVDGNPPTLRSWQGTEVTHSGSIIFAHHNAPIQPLMRLAEKLVRGAKDRGSSDMFACQVLESFDNLGTDVDEARVRGLAGVFRGHPELLILKGGDMESAFEAFGKISAVVPKKIIYDVLREIRAADPDPETVQKRLAAYPGATALTQLLAEKLEQTVQKRLAPYPGARGFFEAFRETLIPTGPDTGLRSAAAWFHLSQLWDYLVDPADIGQRARREADGKETERNN
jgi:hypothetical protein